MSDFVEPSAYFDEFDIDEFPGYAGRRRKAAFTLTMLWGSTLLLHLVSWGSWLVWGMTLVLSTHAVRLLFARPSAAPALMPSVQPTSTVTVPSQTSTVDKETWAAWPYVSVLVAAKNEESVITKLVDALCNLDYPTCRYDLWIIDDNSSDRTPQVLNRLTQEYPQLHVVRRPAGATGGKSGALNEVWPNTQGDLIAVFDADAQVPADLLRRVVPYFAQESVGAVQVRKAIANAGANFWTRGQQAEMALDSYFQQQRIAVGGIGELRGNGQFVRREAIEHCGGWNEETITDDLDLTMRLHLNGWDIQFCLHPAVREEGVTQAVALWHQRNRWAEGGYQRYLDYWRLIAQNRMTPSKSFDLFVFWLMQYGLPTVALPDLLLALARNRVPVFAPLTSLAFSLSMLGMFAGIRRTQQQAMWPSLVQTLRGFVYMFHWLLVISAMAMRLSVRQKRLRWVKTTHLGLEDDLPIDISGEMP
ncbi:glycosyltransferase family 2 protein [Pseudanabaena sp. FACHB-2040]|uniref:glycosyltransferase n=1 Tax=Pseudanabaena sp. FACHB-2040 TaxID=2692859 RepID=UPI001686C963|nr:glycosyltransferase family 2 protein [Pseudanabaena sp. FACHB-2040]MBD2260067.1 glycosyltransferase family 2 protein [Pseudanabaena sp. FACHB-2040]